VTLPSGRAVKVTSVMLVWGLEHDERLPEQDAFSLDFVSSAPEADDTALQREALEVFELIRPASELWGFRRAQLFGFPTLQHERARECFIFVREADGTWRVERQPLRAPAAN
jgi:hypothetical protein